LKGFLKMTSEDIKRDNVSINETHMNRKVSDIPENIEDIQVVQSSETGHLQGGYYPNYDVEMGSMQRERCTIGSCRKILCFYFFIFLFSIFIGFCESAVEKVFDTLKNKETSNIMIPIAMKKYRKGLQVGGGELLPFCDGPSLDKLIENRKKPTLQKVLQIMKGIYTGLHFLHQNQIIHRDIKPQNVMLCKEGNSEIVKIIDFDAAVFKSDKEIPLVGTHGYFTPEMIALMNAKKGLVVWTKAAEANDIYSAGVTFLQLLVLHSTDFPDDFFVKEWNGILFIDSTDQEKKHLYKDNYPLLHLLLLGIHAEEDLETHLDMLETKGISHFQRTLLEELVGKSPRPPALEVVRKLEAWENSL